METRELQWQVRRAHARYREVRAWADECAWRVERTRGAAWAVEVAEGAEDKARAAREAWMVAVDALEDQRRGYRYDVHLRRLPCGSGMLLALPEVV